MRRGLGWVPALAAFGLVALAASAFAAESEKKAPEKCLTAEGVEVPCDSPEAAEERGRLEAERERRERWEDIRGRGRAR